LWTVGFFDPKGNWQPSRDCESESEAREEVHYLNGGSFKASVAQATGKATGEAKL
jgi:hypothetical protein